MEQCSTDNDDCCSNFHCPIYNISY
ncbi:hypothetical protein ACFFH2_02530 [Enterococcus devriesei]